MKTPVFRVKKYRLTHFSSYCLFVSILVLWITAYLLTQVHSFRDLWWILVGGISVFAFCVIVEILENKK